MLIVEQWDEACGLWRMIKSFAPASGEAHTSEFAHDYSAAARNDARKEAASHRVVRRGDGNHPSVRIRELRSGRGPTASDDALPPACRQDVNRIIWHNSLWCTRDNDGEAWIEAKVP